VIIEMNPHYMNVVELELFPVESRLHDRVQVLGSKYFHAIAACMVSLISYLRTHFSLRGGRDSRGLSAWSPVGVLAKDRV